MLERDLYVPVCAWLRERGWEPKGEVSHCDILALNEDKMLAVELKLSLNLEVILQAVDRQRFTHMVYIAVVKNGRMTFAKRWKNLLHLLRRLELGLLVVNFKLSVPVAEEVLAPVPFDRARSAASGRRKAKKALDEFESRHGDNNTGGSTRQKLVTAYREKALFIAALLEKEGALSIARLKGLGTNERTALLLQKNYYGWFDRVKTGTYALNDKGKQALVHYSQLVEKLMEAKCGAIEATTPAPEIKKQKKEQKHEKKRSPDSRRGTGKSHTG